MLGSTVTITFSADATSDIGQQLPLADFGEVLGSFEPDAVRLEVVRSRQEGFLVLLNADWGSPARPSSVTKAELLKRTVARLEGELGYNAGWGDSNWYASDEPWAFVEPTCRKGTLPSGKPISVIFEPSMVANEIFKFATINDFEVYYGINMQRASQSPEQARSFVPALAELQSNSSRAELILALTSVISCLNSPGWTARECYGLPLSANQYACVLEGILTSSFVKAAPFLSGSFIEYDWKDTPFHNSTADEYVSPSTRRSNDYLKRLFNRLFRKGEISSPGSFQTLKSSSFLSANTCHTIKQNFVFISYSHLNKAFAKNALLALQNAKIPYWMDDGIGGGTVWDEFLEKRIQGCSILLACVSDEYRSSKYCRREIKFADLLHKPILPVSEKPWSWGTGLQLMFQELQILNIQRAGWLGVIDQLRELNPALKMCK